MNKSKRPSYLRIKNGKIYARVTWIDENGKRRDTERRVSSRTEAREVYEELRRQVAEHGSKHVDGDRVTLAQLAELYERRKVTPPKIHAGRKVAGLKSYRSALSYLKVIKSHFGNQRIKKISFSDLEDFKQRRLDAPKDNGKPRAIASVNRELGLLRRMFTFARCEGWMTVSPFERGEGLISVANEEKRARILSQDEEARLLSRCVGIREHLHLIVVVAIDTGMRRGELFKLRWSDVDFASGVVRLRVSNTKTEQARHVGITERMKKGLSDLQAQTLSEGEDLIFPYTDVKHSFKTACQLAGIDGLRFHDLRHTNATRLVEGGLETKLVMKLTGHTQQSTFDRYVNPEVATARRAAEIMGKNISIKTRD